MGFNVAGELSPTVNVVEVLLEGGRDRWGCSCSSSTANLRAGESANTEKLSLRVPRCFNNPTKRKGKIQVFLHFHFLALVDFL